MVPEARGIVAIEVDPQVAVVGMEAVLEARTDSAGRDTEQLTNSEAVKLCE